MKRVYYIAGIRFRRFFSMIFKNGLSLKPRFISRFFYLVWTSALSSIFTIYDKIFYEKKMEKTILTEDPVFIIGHWRSGTTMLYQLLRYSRALSAPTITEVGSPKSIISSGRFLTRFFKNSVRRKRTIDNVEINLEEPQEDEFAMFRLTSFSPIKNIIFPDNSWEKLKKREEYLPEDKVLKKKWGEELIKFYKRVSYKSGKRLLIKNPFHSMRILYLKTLFPRAKFIHIHRDPMQVIPSTKRMWQIDGKNNTLRNGFVEPTITQITMIYKNLLSNITSELKHVSSENFIEISFEETEKNPEKTVRKICNFCNIDIDKNFHDKINDFVKTKRNYKKNSYNLTPKEEKLISNELSEIRERYGYEKI